MIKPTIGVNAFRNSTGHWRSLQCPDHCILSRCKREGCRTTTCLFNWSFDRIDISFRYFVNFCFVFKYSTFNYWCILIKRKEIWYIFLDVKKTKVPWGWNSSFWSPLHLSWCLKFVWKMYRNFYTVHFMHFLNIQDHLIYSNFHIL